MIQILIIIALIWYLIGQGFVFWCYWAAPEPKLKWTEALTIIIAWPILALAAGYDTIRGHKRELDD